jgi:amidase
VNPETQVAHPFGQIYELRPDQPLDGLVPLDAPLSLRTIDSSGGQIRAGVAYDDLDTDRFFPVVGPIEIEGVKRGDTVGIEILEIRPDPVAYTWTRPGLGLLGDRRFSVLELETESLEIRTGGAAGRVIGRMPSRPHIGALGLLPDSVRAPRTLGRYGGNLDFSAIAAGATVWLRAEVDGGGFFIGDVHAGIGDGEVCGTGAETGAHIVLRFHRSDGWSPGLPTVEDEGGRMWAIGIGGSFEQALSEATQYCVARLSESEGISPDEAYLAVGLLMRIQVCQVVNPRTSVAVSLAGGVDRVLRG